MLACGLRSLGSGAPDTARSKKGRPHERPRRSGASPHGSRLRPVPPGAAAARVAGRDGGRARDRRPPAMGGGAGRQARHEPHRQARGRRGRHRSRPVPEDASRRRPQLAELVKAGKLPPGPGAHRPGPAGHQAAARDRQVRRHLAPRVHRARSTPPTGTGSAQNDKLLYFDYTGTKVVPNIARGWEVSPDGKVTTLLLRRGMKWSDGQPFTADDFVFWYQDVYQNKELVPTPLAVMTINGKPIAIEKVDANTVRFVVAGAVLRAADRARLGVGHRAPRALRARRAGRVRARALPEAVPPEVRLEGRARQEGRRR